MADDILSFMTKKKSGTLFADKTTYIQLNIFYF